VLVRSGLGDENEDSGKSTTVANPAGQRTDISDQGDPTRDDPTNNVGQVRHHGALGVLLSQSDGAVIIVGVIPGSPAQRAGIRSGDEIRYVGDQRIRTIQELIETIGGLEPGTRVDLLILRNARRLVVEANLASREVASGSSDASRHDDAAQSQGLTAGSIRLASQGSGLAPRRSSAAIRQILERQRLISQQLLTLERQNYRLQQELNELRYSQNLSARQAGDLQQWWERQHHGEGDDDPALFQ
jgi:hypothetical protein